MPDKVKGSGFFLVNIIAVVVVTVVAATAVAGWGTGGDGDGSNGCSMQLVSVTDLFTS